MQNLEERGRKSGYKRLEAVLLRLFVSLPVSPVRPHRPATKKNQQKKGVRLRLVTLYSAWLAASVLPASAGLDMLRFSFFEKLPDNSCAQLQLN